MTSQHDKPKRWLLLLVAVLALAISGCQSIENQKAEEIQKMLELHQRIEKHNKEHPDDKRHGGVI